MDPRSGRFWAVVLLAALVLGGGVWLFTRPEAASAVKAVDGAADAATGAQAVRVGEEVKADARDLIRQHRDALEEAASSKE